ncbi:hypothetical protein BGI15_10530 [Snodgrassella alvi]|nr:hypothetical protein BGI07_08615 [Snodgrassella alvi]ORF32266.1 hypothetical protein BGI10_03305 [Snodgrassella alvi]ORF34823.1 hypothetical protein BGI11_03945 [Snodgrassella alvi]ORF37542.1 hypothetical protein BGI13_07785 [Snodgrassella alvi]ORF39010.1 hypothetical protein BGI14_08280 [Snodgrassella alvi]
MRMFNGNDLKKSNLKLNYLQVIIDIVGNHNRKDIVNVSMKVNEKILIKSIKTNNERNNTK